MSEEENLEKIKKEYQNGATYKEIEAKFGITRNRLVYLKDKYDWKRKKDSRSRAMKKNKNSKGATFGNKRAVTTGLYENLFKGAFSEEELQFIKDTTIITPKEELINTYKTLLIRKARIMKRLQIVEANEKEMFIESIKKKNDGYSTETETIAKSKNDEVVKFHRALTDVDNQIAKTLERLDLILKDDPDKPGKFRTTSILEEITKQMGGGINE